MYCVESDLPNLNQPASLIPAACRSSSYAFIRFAIQRMTRRITASHLTMKRLWRTWPGCIIQASFSQERMQYLDQEGKAVYTSKDGRTSKSFPTLKWLAILSSHIPSWGGQIVQY